MARRSAPWGLLALVTAAAWAWHHVDRATAPSARSAVAMLLYGEPDPERITATGLHGLGGRLVSVALTQDGPCRFTVSTQDQAETIDFARVSSVRFAEMADPASGLAGMASRPKAEVPKRLNLVVIEGDETAICSGEACASRRIFARSRPAPIKAVGPTSLAALPPECRRFKFNRSNDATD